MGGDGRDGDYGGEEGVGVRPHFLGPSKGWWEVPAVGTKSGPKPLWAAYSSERGGTCWWKWNGWWPSYSS